MKDKWGIPVLRFHWKWSDYEINQAKHMREIVPRDPRDDGRHGERRAAQRTRRADDTRRRPVPDPTTPNDAAADGRRRRR